MKKTFTFFLALISAIAAFVSLRWLTKSREDTSWEDALRPGKVLAVDGVALHYVERGDASRPHIVMVHGFGGHTFSFRYQLEEFSRDYHCIAIDLKGFGYSERQKDGDFSMTEQARLVLRAMDILKIEKATLIGHSMGGAVVMRMAAAAPERVERLILAASVSGQRVPMAPRLPFVRPFLPGLSRLVMVRDFGKKMFYDPASVDVEGIRATYLEAARVEGSMNTIWNMWRDLREEGPIDFERITCPVLVLAAEKERVIPFYGRAIAYLRSKMPQAEVQIVPRTGHLLLEEQPEAANAAIRSFLGTIEARPDAAETAAVA